MKVIIAHLLGQARNHARRQGYHPTEVILISTADPEGDQQVRGHRISEEDIELVPPYWEGKFVGQVMESVRYAIK